MKCARKSHDATRTARVTSTSDRPLSISERLSVPETAELLAIRKHSQHVTLMRYAHATRSSERDASERLGRELWGASG